MVDAVFAPDFPAAGGDVLIATYAFALQIYGDFAGYSTWRGHLAAVRHRAERQLPLPLLRHQPARVLAHWHISLSTWLRDYLYKPLGGSRGGRLATNRNLLITMVLGGLWHGAAWSFVLWGAYQGAGWSRTAATRRGAACGADVSLARVASIGAWLVDAAPDLLWLAAVPRPLVRADPRR
jgi:D-alanyl-lipoteichoic acid acyltransferase DltB (MBOAT superfamily)